MAFPPRTVQTNTKPKTLKIEMWQTPRICLNDGNQMPVIGLGTWKSSSRDVFDAVRHAIDVGYRHFDCAYIYGNEREIGQALASKIRDGVVARKDLFVTNKLWNTHHFPDVVEPICRTQLRGMGLDYFDLYLIHYPVAYKQGRELHPRDEFGNIEISDVDYLETWKAMEGLVDRGLVRSIGVSNFNVKQMERLHRKCRIKPVNNQIESHPYLNQNRIVDYCKSKNITVTAYCPLGSPGSAPERHSILRDPFVINLAEKYDRTPAQVLLRYQIQRGNVAIPKSVHKSRIEENFQIFDFQLSGMDLRELANLDCNRRVCKFLETSHHKFYPFEF